MLVGVQYPKSKKTCTSIIRRCAATHSPLGIQLTALAKLKITVSYAFCLGFSNN